MTTRDIGQCSTRTQQPKDVVAAASLIKIYAETMRNDRNPSVFRKSLKFLLTPLCCLLLVSPFRIFLFSLIIMLLFNINPFPLKYILQRIRSVRKSFHYAMKFYSFVIVERNCEILH